MPDLSEDGWCLDNGEMYAAAAPSTFKIPHLDVRQALEPGDLAKLIFRITLDDADGGPGAIEEYERMWVIVRERTSFGYLGVLDNKPYSIAENDSLWLGTELPFCAHHIIDVERSDETSRSIARSAPRIAWK